MSEEQTQAEETDSLIDLVLHNDARTKDRLLSVLHSVAPLPTELLTFRVRKRRSMASLRISIVAAAALLAILTAGIVTAITYLAQSDGQAGRGAPVYLVPVGSAATPQLIDRNGGVEAFDFEGATYAAYWPSEIGNGQADPASLELRRLEDGKWLTIVQKMGTNFSFSVTAGLVAFAKEGSLIFASLQDGSPISSLLTPPGAHLTVLGISPTGDAVAVRVVTTELSEELWLLRQDGSSEKVASVANGTLIVSADWLDSDSLLVRTGRVQVPPSLFRLKLGGNLQPFGPEDQVFWGAFPAPGADRIALVSAPNADGLHNVVMVDSAGTELFSIPLETFEDWSPDARRFVTSSKNALHVYTRDGDKQEDIALPPKEPLGIVRWTTAGQSIVASGGMN